MAVEVGKLLAAINPDLFCKAEKRGKVKALVKEKGYLDAAKEADLIDSQYYDLDDMPYAGGAFAKSSLKNPLEFHKLSYDFPGGSLEPVYFWLLDYLNSRYGSTYKLADNFFASPGSSHFAEMGGRATRMQEEAMKMLGAANQVIKSILNIIYDLKEFKMRLQIYDDYRSKDKATRGSALLSLKQIWMDSVDIKRGNSSLKAMAQQFDYVTLIDAFMAADSVEVVKKSPKEGGLDLNERVKRIILQRIGEFFRWLEASENELRKRFEIEKKYLNSQVNSVKLYSRWIKPYLEAAQKLEQHADPKAEVINAFNTTVLELKVLAASKFNVMAQVHLGELPELYETLVLDKPQDPNKRLRDYYQCAIVELRFISIPERMQQGSGGYAFRGKVELNFIGCCLNAQEVEILKKEIDKSDFGDLMGVAAGVTDESLKDLQNDIDEFLADKKEEKDEEEDDNDTNPFSALFSFLKFGDKKSKSSTPEKKEDISHGITKDNYYEVPIRNLCTYDSRKEARKLYELYKKAYGMPAF